MKWELDPTIPTELQNKIKQVSPILAQNYDYGRQLNLLFALKLRIIHLNML
jgi:hypothetical protein